MKKLITLFLCLCLMAVILPAAAETAAEPATAVSQVSALPVNVYFVQPGNLWCENFPVYFADGVEDLPYIDLEDWKDLLVRTYAEIDGSIGDKVYGLTMKVEKEGKTVTMNRENGRWALFDFENRQIVFDDYMAFIQPPNSGYMGSPGFPAMKNGEPFLLQSTRSRILYGDMTFVDLAKYDIPMIAQDGKYLVPMQTLSGFLLTGTGVGIYFNGKALYVNAISGNSDPKRTLETNLAMSGLLTPDLMAQLEAFGGTPEEALELLLKIISEGSDTGKAIAEQYRQAVESSLYLEYRSVPVRERSDELIAYGINELALELDCFYGLKESHNIKDFYTFFLQNELGEGLMDPDAAKADQAIADMTQYWLDDGHSGFVSSSWMSSKQKAEDNIGFSVASAGALNAELGTLRMQYPDAAKPYYEVGDTAYITLDQFVLTSDAAGIVDYYALLAAGGLPGDTIGIINFAHGQITRENSPIKNVVLDLSINNGGMTPAMCFTLGWFLGEANYSNQNTYTGAQTTKYFRADVNLDHQFDANDTLAGRGLNLFCLISPKSFSCGNMAPWVFKESGTVTLLGKTSGGGSCIVGFNTTAWGTSYQYSSNNRMSFVKNGSYYDVDKGVDPDFTISDYNHFYDREALTEFIHGLF